MPHRVRGRLSVLPPAPAAGRGTLHQEVALKEAMDRAEILSVTETVKTPAGEFKNCLKIEETTPAGEGDQGRQVLCAQRGIDSGR